MKTFFLSTILLSSALFAEDQLLRGVVLVDARSSLLEKEQLADVHGVRAVGVNLPGTLEELATQLEPLYVNQPIAADQVQKIKQAVASYYESKNRPFVLVTAPQQNVTDGVLQLLVMNATVGSIAAAPAAQKYFRTEVGQEVQPDLIAQDLAFMNRNPFRHSEVIYSPGDAPGTTNVTVVTEEKRPYRVYTGVKNNGVTALQNSRVHGGFSVGNLFDLDHSFSFEYTTSGNFSQLKSFKAEYEAPLPWRHIVKTRVGYSDTLAPLPQGLNTHGSSYLANVQYTVPYSTADWQREFVAGVEFKNTNSEQEFVRKVLTNKSDVNIFQLSVASNIGLKTDAYQFESNTGVFFSPGEFLPRQEAAEYAKLRPGTTASWLYGKGKVKYKHNLPASCTAAIQLVAQVSLSKLLPSEQLGLGGVETVRGYASRKINLDDTFVGNFEFALPSFGVVSPFFSSMPKDQIQFMGFVDGGWGFETGGSDHPLIENLLLSFGPAVRYEITNYFSTRFDWGFTAHDGTSFAVKPGLVHFSAVASY